MSNKSYFDRQWLPPVIAFIILILILGIAFLISSSMTDSLPHIHASNISCGQGILKYTMYDVNWCGGAKYWELKGCTIYNWTEVYDDYCKK